ncbi:UNVERIFIED_CONTAM: hypothetical protein RMT77_000207 [Armadillidium vulgare]
MALFESVYNSTMKLTESAEGLIKLNLRLLSLYTSVLIMLIIVTLVLIFINIILIKFVLKFIPSGNPEKLNIAFFHPYCNAGGGGERVLWTSIQAIQSRYPDADIYIYTGDTDATPQQIKENCQQRFNITLEREPQFIFLNFRGFVEAKYYPFFTLLMQSLGSAVLGAEALSKFRPQIFVDSMGYSFTYPLFRFIGGCSVISYTHYPTISSDMLQRVSDRTEAHNNRAFISHNIVLSFAKLIYYHVFAIIYGLMGSCAHVVMVNSTWTKNHISSLWTLGAKVDTVFPPCDTEKFSNIPLIDDSEKDFKTIVSIGQFRPEKDYPKQLRIFQKLLESVDDIVAERLRLILIGGVRNAGDAKRVSDLKALSVELGIDNKVIWKINATFTELLQEVQKGTFGIHTMWNEHFGIGVVECMAGGLIVVVHDSGGPKLDIVTPYEGKVTGYLASDEDSFVKVLKSVLIMPNEEKLKIREAARASTCRFSESKFCESFLTCTQHILDRARRS